jgi:replicative DNA helicase
VARSRKFEERKKELHGALNGTAEPPRPARQEGYGDEQVEPELRDAPTDVTRGDADDGPGGSEAIIKAPPGFVWRAVDLVTLAASARRPEMLVKRVLVRHQPAIAGAPHKTLKTTVMCDLAVSASTATPFLGHFDVYKPAKVALFSGESGEWTLMETFRRVCRARGLDFNDTVSRLVVQAEGLPQLSNAEHMDYLRRMLERERVEVFILDPLYLTLLAGMGRDAGQAANLYAMGPLFQNVTRACLEAGATPVLVHHTQRAASRSREPLGLEDLAYAGVAEFARQWLLLSRREDYDGASPGTHKLWMNSGGSAGHGGLWALDVEEGEADDDLDGRVWDVTVSTATEARASVRDERDAAKREKDLEQQQQDDFHLMAAIDQLTARGEYVTALGAPAAGYTAARDLAALSGRRMLPAVERLLSAGTILKVEVTVRAGSGHRTVAGLQRVEGQD